MAKGAHSAAPAKKEKRTAPSRPEKVKIEKTPRPKKEKPVKQPKAVKEVTPEELEEKAAKKAEKIENVKAGSYKALVIVTIIVAVIALGSVALYFVGKNVTESDLNLPNVYIDGIHVGALTKAETEEKLVSEGWQEANTGSLKVTLPRGVSFDVDYVEAGASFTLDQVVNAAYSYGHDGSILNNVKTWIGDLMKANDVGAVEKHLNMDVISAAVAEGIADFDSANDAAVGYDVDLDAEILRMDKGAGQAKLDSEELTQLVCESLLAKETETDFSPVITVPAPDFDSLLAELSSEPQDARYDKATDSIIEEVSGASFDVNEAKRMWDDADMFTTVEIPVIPKLPEVSKAELEELLFRDVLGEKATTLSGSSAARINNINIVAEKLNGLVLEPGEEFSYNGFIGERTREAGFQGAPAYDNGQVTFEIGGGICQGSSTLYYCCLCADLEILDRTEHCFVVAYLPIGLDATVSYPRPDYKFRNNRDYPIKINAWVDYDKKMLNIQILGTNLDGSYVEPAFDRWPVYDDVYTDVQVGWGAVSYRFYYDADGNLLDKVKESYSSYELHSEDIKWPAEKYQEAVDPEGGEETGGDPGGEPDGTLG